MRANSVFEKLRTILGEPKKLPDGKGDAAFLCLNCNHTTPHLVININNEKYHCWICEFGGRGIKKMLLKLHLPKEAQRFSTEVYDLSRTIDNVKQMLRGDVEDRTDYSIAIPEGYKQIYLKQNCFQYNMGYDYLINRGLTDRDILRHNILYNVSARRVLFPSYDSNFKLNYYLTRAIDEVPYKYLNAKIPKTEFIFNEHLIDWTKRLLLVEGVFDSILSNMNSVPILGSIIREQHKLYKQVVKFQTPIIIALDPDAFDKQIKIANTFINNNIEVLFVDMRSTDKDIADLGPEGFENILTHNSKNYDLRSRIEGELEIL